MVDASSLLVEDAGPTPENSQDAAMMLELNERLNTTTAELERVAKDNEALVKQIDEFSELMELAAQRNAELEEQLKNDGDKEAEIRAKVIAESASEELQSAIRLKSEIVGAAKEEAARLESEARAKAAAIYQQIVDEAHSVREQQEKLAAEAKAQYDDTMSRLAILSGNITKTLEGRMDLPTEVSPSSIPDGATPTPKSSPVEAEVTAPAASPVPAVATPEVTPAPIPAGSWQAASNGNSVTRAQAAADRLRNLTKR